MKATKAIITCPFLILITAVASLAQGYRGIVPLHSNCEDVKRILGVVTCEPPNNTYELEDESVRIIFSKQTCEKAWAKSWNVPPNTVISIERFPKKPMQASDLNVDLHSYTKLPPNDVGEVKYENNESGLQFTLLDGEVRWIVYTPTPTDDYLLCANQSESQQEASKIKLPSFWFDRYGDLPFSKEKGRLDNLVRELRLHSPNTQVYIVAYTNQRNSKGEAKERSERAKSYLVNEHGIKEERIVTINGGYREELIFEIYIVPCN